MLHLRLPIPRFITASEVYMNKGAIGVLKALGAVKTFVLVSHTFSKDHALMAQLEKSIGSHDVKIFAKPSSEPTLQQVSGIANEMAAYQPDWIIGIGGGSVLDCAKMAWALYEHPELTDDLLQKPFSLPPLRGKSKLVCVPTTIGTGSEVSSTAVYLDDQTKQKKFLITHEILPDLVILDPLLLKNVPYHALAYSALDALTHAIEGYVSKYDNAFLDIQAIAAIRTIFDYLPNLKNNLSDADIMLELMMASMMAGWVQNMKVPGLSHALSHQMAQFGMSHGLACGIFLPISIDINSSDPDVEKKYRKLALALGMKSSNDLKDKCSELFHSLEMSPKMSSYLEYEKILKENNEAIIQGALSDPCARANPLKLTESHIATALLMGG